MTEKRMQELIDTLKHQGVQRGQEEADRLAAEARARADQLLAEARTQAAEIVEAARQETLHHRRQVESALTIGAAQFVTHLKQAIEQDFLILPLKAALKEALDDAELLKQLLKTLVEKLAAEPDASRIQVLLPPDTEKSVWEFTQRLMGRLFKRAGKDDAAQYLLETQDITAGFVIDRLDDHVRIEFSDEAFLSLFMQFLAPRFRQIFKAVKLTADIGS